MINEFLLNIVGSLAADALKRLRIPLPTGLLPVALAVHRQEMEEKLAAMPFIYRDLELEILTDFVEVDLGTVHPDTLQSRTSETTLASRSPFDRLKDQRKAVLVGAAGAGKTTFQRFAMLSQFHRLPEGRVAHSRESLVPLYVPLKAIENIRPFPIINYLLSNNSVFSQPRGLERLTRLAKQRRLFLLLDGYDEIPTAGDISNIRHELSSIFGASVRQKTGLNPQMEEVLDALRGCRAWLTSRKEFLSDNDFDRTAASTLEVKGIEKNRMRLVAIIFNKYRAKAQFYKERLSEEHFMQQLEISGAEEFSRNPLFLTVMCYVYVNELREADSPNEIWFRTIWDVIGRCLSLLIVDIDEHKARGLPEIQRSALIRRRAPWADEKRRFLFWFAAELYFDRTGVFDRDFLLKKALTFFRKESTPIEIISGLESDFPTANLVLQLIYSGVFVVVDNRDGCTIYDFPHRRFREYLASEYLIKWESVERVLGHVADPAFAELLYVLVERSTFGVQILSALSREIIVAAESETRSSSPLTNVFARCAQITADVSGASRISQELIRALLVRGAYVTLPASLIALLGDHGAFFEEMANAFEIALESGDMWGVALAGRVLCDWRPARARQLVEEHWDSVDWGSKQTTLASLAVRMDPEKLCNEIDRITDESQRSDLLCVLMGRSPWGSKVDTARVVLERTSVSREWFLNWLRKHEVAAWASLTGASLTEHAFRAVDGFPAPSIPSPFVE